MKYVFPAEVEAVLQAQILPDLEKGRKGFDLLHTQAVVYWAKEIFNHLPATQKGVDPLVLITAAYAHDWGYYRLFEGIDHRSIELVHKMKPLHMERGAEMISKLLKTKLDAFFTPSQQDRVAHLVRVHDLVEQLQAEDEVLIMEADTFGMMDADRMTPTFSKADNDIFMERELKNRRFRYFKHAYAKKMAEVLFQKRLAFYEQPGAPL